MSKTKDVAQAEDNQKVSLPPLQPAPTFVQPYGNAAAQEELKGKNANKKNKKELKPSVFSLGKDQGCAGVQGDNWKFGVCTDKDTGENIKKEILGEDAENPWYFGLGFKIGI